MRTIRRGDVNMGTTMYPRYAIHLWFGLRYLCAVTLVFGLCLAVAPARIVQASTITVTNTNDKGAGSLRHAIANAAAGDTIVFAPNLSGVTITLTSGALVINKNLTISGPGAEQLAVDGNHKYRVFQVNKGKTVTISGLTITNGYIRNAKGGGIHNSGALTLANSIVSGNETNSLLLILNCGGGGVYNASAGTLTVTHSIIRDNRDKPRSSGGGGVYNDGVLVLDNTTVASNQVHSTRLTGIYGGGGILNNGTATISASTVVSNSATGFTYGGGGGIYNAGALRIADSILVGNLAISTWAGGIFNAASGGLTIERSAVTGNLADKDGGGIENVGALTIIQSTISGNAAHSGDYGGGGIDNTDGVVTMVNATLSNNAADNHGGGLLNTDGEVMLLFTTISGNSANEGGGVYNSVELAVTTLIMTNTIVANSLAGGDCTNNGGVITNTNVLISDNSCGATLSGDPLLGPLQNNGGGTETHALLAGSPAIDQAACEDVTIDQRGYLRPVDIPTAPNVDSACDIGAVEEQLTTP
ncbi:MAG: hypothetical protein M1546_12035 [Chloroflexi bacterium]|nr:hypothetical protein [Chloroflexota bacterium]